MSNAEEAMVIAKELEGEFWFAMKDTIIELFDQMVDAAPVDTGFLQSKLYVDISPHRESEKRPGKGPFSPPLSPSWVPKASKYYFGGTADYTEIIEYGGHSAQAPSGFIRVTLAKADDIFAAFLSKTKLG